MRPWCLSDDFQKLSPASATGASKQLAKNRVGLAERPPQPSGDVKPSNSDFVRFAVPFHAWLATLIVNVQVAGQPGGAPGQFQGLSCSHRHH